MTVASVHWLLQATVDVPADTDWLAASEAAFLSGLRVSKRRNDWRLGRWTAKRTVAGYVGVPRAAWARLEIRAAESGAPEVFLDRQRVPLAISISHSDGLAVCTVARSGVALGCDIERVKFRSEAFVTDYFCDEERAALAGTLGTARGWGATLMWSAKESALKALGEGLRLDTRSVIVTVPESVAESGWRPLSVRLATAGQVFNGWWRVIQRHILTTVALPCPALPVAVVTAI